MRKNGKRSISILTAWGSCRLSLRRGYCPNCDKHVQALPLGLDHSGLSPRALKRVLDQTTRLPFREAREALAIQGLALSLSHCERLTQSYGEVFEGRCVAQLKDLAEQPLATVPAGAERLMVAQADGVFVMEQDKPVPGQCEGREVKQVLFYPGNSPSERDSYASTASSDDFMPLAQGLMRQAGVRQSDVLVGVGDGAPWIEELFDTLGVEQRVLDVYHATLYLERVLLALNWSEAERETERRLWLRGEVNARDWCLDYLPPPQVCSQWSAEVRTALRYLQQRLDSMDYKDYKDKGWPIGSGQIEGANKSVIGARMKRGGMRWSPKGIPRMAALRSAQLSKRPLADFRETRLAAFHQN